MAESDTVSRLERWGVPIALAALVVACIAGAAQLDTAAPSTWRTVGLVVCVVVGVVSALTLVVVVVARVGSHFRSRGETRASETDTAMPLTAGATGPSGSLEMQVIRGQESPDVDAVDWELHGREVYVVQTNGPPLTIRFTQPAMLTVRSTDLPATLYVGDNPIVTVKKFLDRGFSVEEHVSTGRVRAETYAHAETAVGRGQAFGATVVTQSSLPAQVTCRAVTEEVSESITLAHAHKPTYEDNVTLWVLVRNDGPTSDFVASIPRVSGVPWPEYTVPHPRWSHTIESRVEIPHGVERRLKVANVARSPRAFFFHTVENGVSEYGMQYVIADTKDVEITFDLGIVNVGSTDETTRYEGRVVIYGDGRTPLFNLSPQGSGNAEDQP